MVVGSKHLTMTELTAGLGRIYQSPKDEGVLDLIVRRPQTNEREVLEEAELDPAEGLIGDSWKVRGSSRTSDGASHPDPVPPSLHPTFPPRRSRKPRSR